MTSTSIGVVEELRLLSWHKQSLDPFYFIALSVFTQIKSMAVLYVDKLFSL